MSVVADRQDDLTPVRQVYEPHRVGLPPLRSYFREIWQRRQFVLELAKTDLRSQHYDTVLGQLWLVLNPLLLGLVFFVLVEIIGRRGQPGGEFLGHLLGMLFTFRFVTMSIKQGSRSVTGGGKLILNTAFPRALLPVTAVLTAFIRFLPTVPVYAVLFIVVGLPVGLHLLWVIPIFAIMTLFALGGAMLAATLQVYFRDFKQFVRYGLRMWLYTSPIIWYVHEVPDSLNALVSLNPLYPMLGSLSNVLDRGGSPDPLWLLWSLGWAVVFCVIGSLAFMSREREFAVRL